MKKATNFYRIGLFTVLGLTVFVMLLLVMGGKSWFNQTINVETYFDESVQGLEVGSDVKYRGVRIGKVTNIGFVDDIYNLNGPKDSTYFNHFVYVLMSINLNLFSKEDQSNIQQILNLAIKNGMRIHLAPEGLTGSSYLELDFYNPQKNPPLPINWVPQNIYIPSKLSTLSLIAENLNKFVQGLGEANIGQIMQNIDKTTSQTSAVMSRVNMILSNQQQNIESSLTNIRAISDNLRSLTDNAKNYPASVLLGNKPPKLDLPHEQQKN